MSGKRRPKRETTHRKEKNPPTINIPSNLLRPLISQKHHKGGVERRSVVVERPVGGTGSKGGSERENKDVVSVTFVSKGAATGG